MPMIAPEIAPAAPAAEQHPRPAPSPVLSLVQGSPPGLSAHARDLWRTSLRYRRLADELAAAIVSSPAPVAVAAPEDESWLACR